MTAFTKGLKNNKNKELVRSLYLNLSENFNATMSWAKDYMLSMEALDSAEEEDPALPPKQFKKAKRGEPFNKQLASPKSPPAPPKCYTLLNYPQSENLNYIKEESYATQLPPPMKA